MSIEAMKEALEVMKNIQLFDKEDLYGLGYDIDVLSKAIAQAEQAQPVAYQVRTRPTWDNQHGWSKWRLCEENKLCDFKHTSALYGWEYEVRALYENPKLTD